MNYFYTFWNLFIIMFGLFIWESISLLYVILILHGGINSMNESDSESRHPIIYQNFTNNIFLFSFLLLLNEDRAYC